jgi:hypothetical protein
VHFPWWKLKILFMGKERYDVVTSNANLNEFTNNALRDYLTIFGKVMKDDGIFLVQCTGFSAHGSLDTLFDTLVEFKFAPVFCALADENVPDSMRQSMSESYVASGFDKTQFALNNLVMVKETHPLFSANYDRRNYRHGYAAEFNALKRIYKTNTEGRHCSKDELLPRVYAELKGSQGVSQKAGEVLRLLGIWRSASFAM